jgi:hypothetical protein
MGRLPGEGSSNGQRRAPNSAVKMLPFIAKSHTATPRNVAAAFRGTVIDRLKAGFDGVF